MTTAKILKQLRKEKGLRQADVAELLGISQQAYQKYELGNAEPNGANYVKLADFYGVTTDYLLGREPAPDPFGEYDLTDATEDEVIEAFLALPPKIRACILDIMTQLGGVVESSRTAQAEEPKPTWTVCYSEDAVSAGIDYALDEYERMEKLKVVDTPEARRATFAVRVSGDSMESSYSDGDIVLVQQVDQIEQGQIGVFFVNGSGYIKEYGGDRLISHNSKYDDIQLHDSDTMRCFGRVIGIAELP
ncbi:MAG: helix-turn-helix domain-containing protein [Ruminococcus sp.]|nr:helix-turn-helix domain-containing protein [Ruminococcus sp.]